MRNSSNPVGAPVFISFLLVLAAAMAVPCRAADSRPAQAQRFIDHHDGTVTDTRTGLMWAASDNGADIQWWDAKLYCDAYRGGGYTDWRLPTPKELATLYDPGRKGQPRKKSPWRRIRQFSDTDGFLAGALKNSLV